MNEENRCTVRGFRGLYEPNMDMFVDEFSKSSHLRLRKGVHWDDGRDGTVFQVDFQIVRMMWRKCISFAFTEDISKVVVFLRDVREVRIGRYRSRFASDGGVRKRQTETLHTR